MKRAVKSADPIGCAVEKISAGVGRPIITGILTIAMILGPVPLSSFARAEEAADTAVAVAEEPHAESAQMDPVQEEVPDTATVVAEESQAEPMQEAEPESTVISPEPDAAADLDAAADGAMESAPAAPSSAPARGPLAAPANEPTITVTVGGDGLDDGGTAYVAEDATISVSIAGVDPDSTDAWSLTFGDGTPLALLPEGGGTLTISYGLDVSSAGDGPHPLRVLCEGGGRFGGTVVIDTADPVASISFDDVADLCDSGIIAVFVEDGNLDAEASYAQLLDGNGNAVGGSHAFDSNGEAAIDLSAVDDGVYSGVYVHAVDKAGHENAESNQTFSKKFEIDRTAPVITVEYFDRRGRRIDAADIEGKALNGYVEAAITVEDANFDTENSVVTKTVIDRLGESSEDSNAWMEKSEGVYVLRISFRSRVFQNIANSYRVVAVDALAHSGRKTASFAQDSRPPAVTVNFGLTDADGASTAVATSTDEALGEVLLYAGSHTVSITVEDENLSRNTLEQATVTFSYYGIENNEVENHPTEKTVKPNWKGGGGTFTGTIELDDECVYVGVTVEVDDDLGNLNTNGELYEPEDGTEEARQAAMKANSSFDAPRLFEVDRTAPIIEIAVDPNSPDGTKEGTDVYGREVTATITVTERNFDADAFTIGAGNEADGRTIDSGWVKADDGNRVYTRTITYSEEGLYAELRVAGEDMVGHSAGFGTGLEGIPALILDRRAPTVDYVEVSTAPSGVAAGDESVVQFHNAPTTMTIEFSDTIGIPEDGVEVDGYEAMIDLDAGTVTIAFNNDEYFTRDVLLTLTDYAGNYNVWSITEKGVVKLVASEAVHPDNTFIGSVAGNAHHPELLILDTIAPLVALDGAVAGTYYTADQTITATVDERNFSYTKDQDGRQVIVTITFRPGRAGAAVQTITIPASEFEGADSDWNCRYNLTADGHYAISAQMTDFAGNMSNRDTIGEFTIDRTAPVLSVSFDNNDVRNGRYYNAARTATITVEEHNFDPALFNIETTGSIGSWSASGDIHTCVVSFTSDGTYSLTVSGADIAGNRAAAYAADEFVIDLTAPTITIANYDGSDMNQVAYEGTVAPVITFADEANLDTGAAGTTWTLTRANGAAGDPAEAASPFSGNMRTVAWNDFAHEIVLDDIYTLSAHMTDLAGNEAEAEVEFSVNRFGSTFQILGVDTEKSEWGRASADRQEAGTVLLASAPTIRVREINVSGSSSEIDPGNAHFVDVEHANSTDNVMLVDAADSGNGYLLEEGSSNAVGTTGWVEYNYTILSGNFGEENEAYANDGGQGGYSVTVGSYDRTNGIVEDEDGAVLSYGRVNTSGIFFENEGGAEAEAQAAVGFILDEMGPEIVSVDVPEGVEVATAYRVTVAVRDDVGGDADVLAVKVNGVDIDEGDIERVGAGLFAFDVDAKLFGSLSASSIEVTVTDYDGRSDEATARLNVTTMVGEGAVGAVVLAAAAGGIVSARRRKKQENA